MTNREFAKGINVSRFDFDGGGFVIKLGINKEEFNQNLFNDRGWANFDIKFSKTSGNPYCVVNDYHKTTATTTHAPKQEVESEEVPF